MIFKNSLDFITKHVHAIGFTWLAITVVGIVFLLTVINPLYIAQTAKSGNVTQKSINDISPIISPSTDDYTHSNTVEAAPTGQTQTYQQTADSDPVVECGPGENSGQYVKDKSSNCKKYVDCGLNNNTNWSMMLKSECDAKHSQQSSTNTSNTTSTTYPACTIYYSQLGPVTYYSIPPDQCATQQTQAKVDDTITQSEISCIKNTGHNCSDN
jgi:hypothetical protein